MFRNVTINLKKIVLSLFALTFLLAPVGAFAQQEAIQLFYATNDPMTVFAEVVTPEGSDIVVWEWFFGDEPSPSDGTVTISPEAQHTYTTPGTYNINVLLFDFADGENPRYTFTRTNVSVPADGGGGGDGGGDGGGGDGGGDGGGGDGGGDGGGGNALPASNPLCDGPDDPDCVSTIEELLVKILDFVFNIGLPIIMLAIIWSGFLFVTARGNMEKIKTAKTAVTWTMIGAALILGARVLAEIIRSTISQL